MTVLNIKWGRHRFSVDFPNRILGDIPLGELRERCKELTGVPLGGLQLIYGGATMKDDGAPLSCFGIKPNSNILMMGTKPTKADISELTTNGDPEEYALILRIQDRLDKAVDFARGRVEEFEHEANAYIQSHPPAFSLAAGMPPNRKKLQDLYGILNENLLQALLFFDGIQGGSEFEVARLKRREAVKVTQQLMDRVDDVLQKVKEYDSAARAAAAAH